MRLIPAAAGLLTLMAAAAASGAALAITVAAVTQRDRAFTQKELSAPRGSTLHVVNDDEFVHQIFVDASAMTFESNEQPPGTAIDIPLTATGRFEVRCRIHPKMLLLLTVK